MPVASGGRTEAGWYAAFDDGNWSRKISKNKKWLIVRHMLDRGTTTHGLQSGKRKLGLNKPPRYQGRQGGRAEG